MKETQQKMNGGNQALQCQLGYRPTKGAHNKSEKWGPSQFTTFEGP